MPHLILWIVKKRIVKKGRDAMALKIANGILNSIRLTPLDRRLGIIDLEKPGDVGREITQGVHTDLGELLLVHACMIAFRHLLKVGLVCDLELLRRWSGRGVLSSVSLSS